MSSVVMAGGVEETAIHGVPLQNNIYTLLYNIYNASIRDITICKI